MSKRQPSPQIQLLAYPDTLLEAVRLAPHVGHFYRHEEWLHDLFPEAAVAYRGLTHATRRILRVARDENVNAYAILANNRVRGVATAVQNVTVAFNGHEITGTAVDYSLAFCADDRAHKKVGTTLLKTCGLSPVDDAFFVSTLAGNSYYNRGLYHDLYDAGRGHLSVPDGEDAYGVTLDGREVVLHVSSPLAPTVRP